MRPTTTLTSVILFTALLVPGLAAAAPSTTAIKGRVAWLKYNCAGCHGDKAAGGMGPNIQHAEGGDVSEAMWGDATEGGMRSFSHIAQSSDPAAIAAYLATIGNKNTEPTFLDWWNH